MDNTFIRDYLEKISEEEPSIGKALIHSSYCREQCLPSIDSNERLEYLGDAFLDAIVSTELFERMDDADEGMLTRMRAAIVCEESLAGVGRKMGLNDKLIMSGAEESSGGRSKPSIIADAVEALIGALFLARGYEETRGFVLKMLEDEIASALEDRGARDYKSTLQEVLQQSKIVPHIEYVVDRQVGPEHDTEFFVHLEIDGRKMGEGRGKRKKDAEQQAAKATLEGGYI